MNRLLIIAAKLYNDPSGGGGTVVKDLVDTFVEDFNIDLVLYRTPVKNIYKHKNLKTHFHPILIRNDDKFQRRIMNYEKNLNVLNKNHDLSKYHRIIVVHISKMFGFEKIEGEYLRKTILFPMYLTPSYKRSNENVLSEYTTLENRALSSAALIITPSDSEKSDIVNYYKIDENRVKVIDRGVNEIFFSQPKKILDKPIKLLVVSTIKKQKNVIESVYILKELLDLGIDSTLTIVGKVESNILYGEINDYIDLNGLSNHVSIIQGLNQSDLAKVMKKSDILVLPSLWETFGRVAYEGLSSGLPIVLRENIECFSNLYKQDFIFSYSKVTDVAEIISNIVKNPSLYRELSLKSIIFAKKYIALNEKKKLKEVILWKD